MTDAQRAGMFGECLLTAWLAATWGCIAAAVVTSVVQYVTDELWLGAWALGWGCVGLIINNAPFLLRRL